MEKEIVLRMKGISKRFSGIHALKNVNIDFEKSKVNVIMGENGAGKSTLMRILAGAIEKDEGIVELEGKCLEVEGPDDALKAGITMIYQELNLVPYLSIAENIFIGREIRKHGFVQMKEQIAQSNKLLKSIGIDIDCSHLVNELTVAKQQMVEIAKAIFLDSKILIMDEPTSSLTEPEVKQLFSIIRSLNAKGVTIIYISHRLEEIFEIGDNVTVLRDGTLVGQWPLAELDNQKLIQHMVGRTIDNLFPKEEVPIGEVILDVKNLTKKGQFKNISFNLRRGEILGFSGLVGAGRTELANVLFGKEHSDSGKIILRGKEVKIKQPADAAKLLMGYVPEDRKQFGLNLIGSIKDNIAVTNWNDISTMGFINIQKEDELNKRLIDKLRIKLGSYLDPVSSLSGGNQQKVVLAKWISRNLDVLILDEPTRGVDVGAKAEIHRLIVDLAKNGVGIIMISSELPEIIGMSDRVIIMHEGCVTGELTRGEATQSAIMSYAHGVGC